MSACPNTLENISDQDLLGEYWEEAVQVGDPGYEPAPIRTPSLSSLSSSSDTIGLPSPLRGLSPVRSPDLWPDFWPLNNITSSTVLPLVPYSPSVTPVSTPGTRSPAEPYYWVERTPSASPPPPTISRASSSSVRYSPQRRVFSPPRRSRSRTRRPAREYSFPNERSRSPRTHSSGYHSTDSYQLERRSRSFSPQEWETAPGFNARSLRCLTLVKLPRHFRKREVSVDYIEREYSCSCGRGILNCRLCPTGVLSCSTRFTILASKLEPHRQLLEAAQDILPDQ